MLENTKRRRKQNRIMQELERLRHEHHGVSYRVPMPDLSVDRNPSPTSDRFDRTLGMRSLPVDARQFPVGHSHKQGTILITEGMIKNGELQWLGGRKT
jgi:hypothetical protein